MTIRDNGILAARESHPIFARCHKEALQRFAFAVLYVHRPEYRNHRQWCRACSTLVEECAINRAADAFLLPRPQLTDPPRSDRGIRLPRSPRGVRVDGGATGHAL